MRDIRGAAQHFVPVALTYGRLVRAVPDAGAEIAYAEGVLPRGVGFSAAWAGRMSDDRRPAVAECWTGWWFSGDASHGVDGLSQGV